MSGLEFRRAYLFRHADDLLQHTDLNQQQIAERIGASSAQNLSQLFHDYRHQTPDDRRRRLRGPNDPGRFRL